MMNSSPPSDSSARPSTLRAWLELLRAPNLLTVPGDPLAGFCMAASLAPAEFHSAGGWIPVLPAIFASLLLYAGGLIHNDLSDLNEDRRDRPARPLPSGQISQRSARAVMLLCFAGALAVLWFALRQPAPLIVGALLVAAIVLYNGLTKSIVMLGPVNMGLCRGLSFLLGCVLPFGFHAVLSLPVGIGAAGLVLYIAAVTVLASGEVYAGASRLGRWLPTITAGAWGAAMVVALGPSRTINHPTFLVIFACGVIITAWPAVRLGLAAPPKQIQKSIGWWIRNLLIFQAAFCTLSPDGYILSAVLLALWPIAAILSRRFYAS